MTWTREAIENLVAQRAEHCSALDRSFIRVSAPTQNHAEIEISALVQEFWEKRGDSRREIARQVEAEAGARDLGERVAQTWQNLQPFLEE